MTSAAGRPLRTLSAVCKAAAKQCDHIKMFNANKNATPTHQASIRLFTIGKTPIAHV